MTTIEKLFFELIQVAIGTHKSLSITLSAEQWTELFVLSKKQAVVAIAFIGVSKISPGSKSGGALGIDEFTYLKWMGLTAKVTQRNKELNAECAKVCAELAHDGLRCCVLKGQSNLVNYPEELRSCRTSGDIDLWTLPHPEGIPIAVSSGSSAEYVNYKGISGVVEYAQQWRRSHSQKTIPWHRVLYYHVEVNTDCSVSSERKGIELELHYRPSYFNSPLRNYRLQQWFKNNEPWGMCDARIDNHVFPILPISTNVVYQLLHIYKHLFEEGIGLRQLLDFYFVLNALHKEQKTLSGSSALPLSHEQQGQKSIKGERPEHWQDMGQWEDGKGMTVMSNEEIMHTFSRFGMKKFASAVMYVLQTVFAMPAEYLICEPDEKEGRFLLNEIMQAGNFGKYDDRIARGAKSFMGFKVPASISHAIEKTKHNLRLLMHYPEEVLWEPFFRVYHWIWRRFELWRF